MPSECVHANETTVLAIVVGLSPRAIYTSRPSAVGFRAALEDRAPVVKVERITNPGAAAPVHEAG